MHEAKLHMEPFPFLEIRGPFSEEEKELIMEELEFFNKDGKMNRPETSGSATSPEGELLKENASLYLDGAYNDPKFSDILNINQKVLSFLEPKGTAYFPENPSPSWFFNNTVVGQYNTLISYYDNGEYYKPHRDAATITALSWFYRTPKKFEGGELYFPHYDFTVEVSDELTLIFPSCIVHEVLPIKMDEEYAGKGYGRYSMAQLGKGYEAT